jgi:hypothetical protein
MAAVTVLRIVQRFDRMDVYKIAPVTLGFIVPSEVALGEIGPVAPALVAIKAPLLLMALIAVIPCVAGQDAMSAYKVCIMIWRNALGLVAAAAFT